MGDAKTRFPKSWFAVSLRRRKIVSLARNYQRLAGFLSERGAFSCARNSISDFASLVRKSYSSQSSLDSTVVLVSERIATKSE